MNAREIPENQKLLILSLVVGILCGLAAVLLNTLIRVIHQALTSWLGGGIEYALLFIYPGVGMLLAMLFTRYVIRDNIGH